MPNIDAATLRKYTASLFTAVDTSAAEARIVADHLVEANLLGHDSHGVIRAPAYLQGVKAGVFVPGAEVRIEREEASTALVDGGWNFGQVVARRTMEIAIAKARTAGVAVVIAHRANHVGRLGAYSEQAAAEGLIGVAMANNHGGGRLVAPFGGAERRLSTNPMTFAFPGAISDQPFVLDMATSVAAEGKMRVARNKGQQVADGWLLDAEGRPTNEPAGLYGPPPGAILPLGGAAGHKGFGLSMVVEGLSGALSPAGTSRADARRGGNALFTMVIDPERFSGLAAFTASFAGLTEFVKQPPFSEGATEVLTAGEPERRSRAEREANGIPLDDATWQQLAEAAESVGVTPPAA